MVLFCGLFVSLSFVWEFFGLPGFLLVSIFGFVKGLLYVCFCFERERKNIKLGGKKGGKDLRRA